MEQSIKEFLNYGIEIVLKLDPEIFEELLLATIEDDCTNRAEKMNTCFEYCSAASEAQESSIKEFLEELFERLERLEKKKEEEEAKEKEEQDLQEAEQDLENEDDEEHAVEEETELAEKPAISLAVEITVKEKKRAAGKKSKKANQAAWTEEAEMKKNPKLLIVEDTRLKEFQEQQNAKAEIIFRPSNARVQSVRWESHPCGKLLKPVSNHNVFPGIAQDTLILLNTIEYHQPVVLNLESGHVGGVSVKGRPPRIHRGSVGLVDHTGTKFVVFGGDGTKGGLWDVLDLSDYHWGELHEIHKLAKMDVTLSLSRDQLSTMEKLARYKLSGGIVSRLTSAQADRMFSYSERAEFGKLKYEENMGQRRSSPGCGCIAGAECTKKKHYAQFRVEGAPSIRDCAACVVNDRIFVFGGFVRSFLTNTSQINQSVFEYNYNNWKKERLYYERADEYPDNNMYQRNKYFADVCIVRCRELDVKSKELPEPRYHHTMHPITGNRFVIVGGRNWKGESLNDCWTFNVISGEWKEETLIGSLPPIHSHKMAMSGSNLFIFGGLLFSFAEHPVNNVFVININSWQVQEIQVGGSIPSGRIGHTFTATQNGSNFVVIGGANREEGVLNSVHVLENVENLSFSAVDITNDFAQALLEQRHTDFIFESGSGGWQLAVHRVILAARCKALRDIFEKNPDQDAFVFTDSDKISQIAFKKFVDYLYTDEVVLDLDQAEEIMVIAKKFGVKQLVEICQQFHESEKLVSPSSMFQDLEWMYNNEEFSDITIMCQGIGFNAHKAILCARSQYFDAMMGANLAEASTGIINDDETPFEVFLCLMKYIYFEEINIPPQLVFQCYAYSDLWMLPKLKRVCSDVLARYIDLENCCVLFATSRDYNDVPLQNSSKRFIALNWETLLDTDDFVALEEEALLEVRTFRHKVLGIDTTSAQPSNHSNNIALASSTDGIRNDPNALCHTCGLPYVFSRKTFPKERPPPKVMLTNWNSKGGNRTKPRFSQLCQSAKVSVKIETKLHLEVNAELSREFSSYRSFATTKDAYNQVSLNAIHWLHEHDHLDPQTL